MLIEWQTSLDVQGCRLFRLRTWPNSFNFLSSNMPVRGLILLSGPSVGAFISSLALLIPFVYVGVCIVTLNVCGM